MDLHRILSLLLTLEAAGKLEGRSLPMLYDANGDITLTVRAVDVATREKFLVDVAGTVDEAKITSEPWTEAQHAEWDALPRKEQKAIRDKNLAAQGLAEPVMGKFVSDGVHVNAKTTVKHARKAAAKHKS